jgi:hypothetical protein
MIQECRYFREEIDVFDEKVIGEMNIHCSIEVKQARDIKEKSKI